MTSRRLTLFFIVLLLTAVGVGLPAAVVVHAANPTNPAITWSPGSLVITVPAGDSTTASASFTSSTSLSSVTIAAVPGLAPFLTPSPNAFSSVHAGAPPTSVSFNIAIPASTVPGDYAGSVQLSAGGKLQPKPLSITIHVTGSSRHIFWTSNGERNIGRADVNGQNVNQAFIANASAWGLALDASYIYWSSCQSPCDTPGLGLIGRANRDGTGVNENFISGICDPRGVAVDSSHIYWANFFFCETIGRADLNGQNANDSFIALSDDPFPIVVTADSSFIYWTNSQLDTLGRASLDGTGANQSFITGTGVSPEGVAVDANYIYWVDNSSSSGAIGRANLDGTNANHNFITGLTCPVGIAVDSSYIYWTQFSAAPCGGGAGAGTIGRANLDGTGANPNFITGLTNPVEVAVDPD